MKKSLIAICYNPSLSVKENAEICGVSQSAIRKYIQENNIDRNFDSKTARAKAIKELREKSPHLSLREMSRELGYSVNTIRKYLSEDVSKDDTTKVSKFDTSKNTNIIKSTSTNQDEILANILKLYVGNETFDCDLTYSIGVFYRNIPAPQLKYDKYPQIVGVKQLDDAYNIEDCSLNSVIYDLPFITKQGVEVEKSAIANRFNCFHSASEMLQTNDVMLTLSHKILKKKGILVIKTMDTCYAGKQIWVSDYVIQKATSMGFELLDKFILLSNKRHLRFTGEQRHARKYHSYFLVFVKSK